MRETDDIVTTRPAAHAARQVLCVLVSCMLAGGICPLLAGCAADTGQTDTDASGQQQTEQENEDETSLTLVEDGVLTVAISPYTYPLCYAKGGSYEGFEVELVEELADELGLDIAYVSCFAQRREALLEAGASDCIIGSLSDGDTEQDALCCTQSYLESELVLVVSDKSDVQSYEDVGDACVGALYESAAESWVASYLPDADYTPFQDADDASDALASGTMDAIVCDELVVAALCAQDDELAQNCRFIEIDDAQTAYHIACNSGNEALRDALDEALATLQEDGIVEELEERYLAASDTSSDER